MLCGEVGGETTKANKRNGEGRTGWLVCGARLAGLLAAGLLACLKEGRKEGRKEYGAQD